jgi:PAS domain S-box-containing protein
MFFSVEESIVREDRSVKKRLKRAVQSPNFWIVAGMLAIGAGLHYGAQTRYLLVPGLGTPPPVERHAMERVLFVLPIAYAAFSFGWVGGVVTLSIALLIMLPRVFLISLYPVDAFMETVAVVLVGGLMSWMVETQEKERRLRQEAAARLEAASAISTIVTQSLELRQILNGALDKVMEILHLESRGGIFLMDEEMGELRLAVHRGLPPEFAQEESKVAVGECLCGLAAQTGELIILENCSDDPRHTRSRLGTVHSHVIVPLQARNKVVGVLFLYPIPGYRHSPADVGLLTTISNEIGVAIENAQLHQSIARQLEIETRLNEVAEKITSELELTKVLPTVLEIAEELVGAEGGAIALLDEEKEVISYPYLHNVPEALSYVTVPKGKGLAGHVMTTGHPMMVEDYPTYPDRVEAWIRAGLRSVLNVPIISGDKVFGALGVFSLEGKKVFSDRDIALIAGVGRQAGIAIENARLYEQQRAIAEQLRVSEERYRDLFENANDAILVQDMEGKITAANKACVRLTGYRREELLGMNFAQLLTEESVPIAKGLENRCRIGEVFDQPYELHLVKRDGTKAIIELAPRCITSNGQAIGLEHIARDVTEQRRIQESMRFYISQITRAQEDERKRIARELHDETTQALVALSRRLDRLLTARERLPASTTQRLEELRQLTDNILEGVRRFSQDLRPPTLDDLGLVPTLEGLTDLMSQDGIRAEIRVLGNQRRPSPEEELAVFRIAQEALNNIKRHSQASQVVTTVEFSDDKIKLTISDDGKGFELPDRIGDLAEWGKLGLLGMHERARLLGGTLTVHSKLGEGTTVVVDVPTRSSPSGAKLPEGLATKPV